MKNHFLASTAAIALTSAFANIGYRTSNPVTGQVELPDMTDGDELLKRSPDSEWMLPYWDKADTILEGYDAIVKAGEIYLPKFADETGSEYDQRLKLTKFTNVYRDIVESLAVKPFEKEVLLAQGDKKAAPPQEILDFIEDVDGAGNNLTGFAANTFFNGINSAIDWIFVDFPIVDRERIRTVADAKREGVRVFWSHVLGRNVLEARAKVIAGKEILTYIRIFEPGEPDCVRVFERHDDGNVTWQLYEKVTNPTGKSQFALAKEGTISIGVIPLVPFATGRRDGRTFKFFPMMRDAVDLQIELYQQESGLKFAKTMTAYPMLAANGIGPQMEADGQTPKRLRVGPGRILYSKPDASGNVGSWGFVEPSATSLKFLADDVKETIQQLRELGRQPLTAQSGNLTTITTAVAAGKAKSAVGAAALNLKNTLENALVLTSMWMNIQNRYDPEVAVYTDFDSFLEGGKDVDALNHARDKRDISRKAYISEFKRRNILAPEYDEEIDMQEILSEEPGDDDTEMDGINDNPQPQPNEGLENED